MYYVVLLTEDMCKNVQSERFNISIKNICEVKEDARDKLGKLYRMLQQDEVFSITEYKGSSFHLENLDIDKYSYTGFIVEFPAAEASRFMEQQANYSIFK